MTFFISVLALLLLGITLLPLSGSHRWWIRMWDFPRIQIAAGQAAVIVLAVIFLSGWLLWTVLVPTAAALGLQLWWIRPYTPLARKEMRFAPLRKDGQEVVLLSSNVLMENDRHDLVRDLIQRVDPDVVLLMETDQAWLDGVRPALERYPTLLTVPKDDYYGLIFATRLEAVRAETVYLTTDETPTVIAELKTPGGETFHFVGLHPQPPVPGVDTEDRDTEILYAARFARKTDVPLIAMGDFNDAAWSWSSQLFKHYGRYLDPRLGRGLYASFHAKNVLIRCAIDQLYVTDDIAMVDFRLGPKIGSDHFPVIAHIRIDPEEARRLNVRPHPMTEEEREEIGKRLDDHRSKLDRRRAPQLAG